MLTNSLASARRWSWPWGTDRHWPSQLSDTAPSGVGTCPSSSRLRLLASFFSTCLGGDDSFPGLSFTSYLASEKCSKHIQISHSFPVRYSKSCRWKPLTNLKDKLITSLSHLCYRWKLWKPAVLALPGGSFSWQCHLSWLYLLLKLFRTLWGPPGYKSPSVTPVSFFLFLFFKIFLFSKQPLDFIYIIKTDPISCL